MKNGCVDESYGKLLYTWELGLLGETDREALELHLLECDDCFRRAEKFADTAELLRDSAAVRSALDRHASQTPNRVLQKKHIWSGLVRVSLVAAAVLAVLILRPWQLEFKSTQLAVASANRLAIGNFQNVDDSNDLQRLGAMVAGLLITDLSESEHLQVVSDQRWHDAARLYEAEAGSEIAPVSSLEIARRVSARWLLTGDVAESNQVIQLRSQIIDVGTGVVASSQEVVGQEGEQIFTLVDRLTREVRTDLSMPDEMPSEADRPVAEVTTESQEAYRYYVEGLEYAVRYYNREAIAAFEKALSFDSTFAMAYYQLSLLKDPGLIARAMQYSQSTSWLEQHYIRAYDAEIGGRSAEMQEQLRQIIGRFPDEKDAYFKLGQFYWRQYQFDSALVYLQRTIEIDPMHRAAFNHLMYTYNEAGQFDRAIWAINKYIALAPGEANPYDSRGDLYAENGQPLEAAESYLQALRIKPDFATSAFKLTYIWIYLGEYDQADSLLQSLEKSPISSIRTTARFVQTMIPTYQGEFDFALKAIDTAVARTKQESDSAVRNGGMAGFYRLKAQIYAEKGEFDQALAALDSAILVYRQSFPNDSLTFGYLYAHYLAARGDFAAAENIRLHLVARSQATGEDPCYQFWAAGGIELARGNAVEAVVQLEKGTARTSVGGDFTGNYLLARAYLETGRLGKAVTLLEKLQSIYSSGRMLNPIECVKLHYYLGIAYEESRWYDQATREYRTFLDIWSNADSDLRAIDDARDRLKRLENRS